MAVLLYPAENPRAWLASFQCFPRSIRSRSLHPPHTPHPPHPRPQAPQAQQTPEDSGDQTSNTALAAALASVFSVLAVIGLVALLWWVWRSRVAKKEGISDGDGRFERGRSSTLMDTPSPQH